MSTARLSSLSFQTLSLLLERQRLRALGKSAPSAQLNTISRNMEILRAGILELEREAASSRGGGRETQREDAVRNAEQLRGQWERAKRMLGEEGREIEGLPPFIPPPTESALVSSSSSSKGKDVRFDDDAQPYRDEPARTPTPPPFDAAEETQTQRQMMDEQDTHLDTLSHSIRRQRELSEGIGAELDVHSSLLEDLEQGLDSTALRLGGARRRLDTFARGARNNGSAVTISGLIVVLLILIVVFKT